jgi:hypothetical protein
MNGALRRFKRSVVSIKAYVRHIIVSKYIPRGMCGCAGGWFQVEMGVNGSPIINISSRQPLLLKRWVSWSAREVKYEKCVSFYVSPYLYMACKSNHY